MAESGHTDQWETAQDGLDKLTRSRAPIPQPGKNEVLVQISCVSLNYRDTEGTCSPGSVPDAPTVLGTGLLTPHVRSCSRHGTLYPSQVGGKRKGSTLLRYVRYSCRQRGR
jgi:hypothetical protein